MPSDADESFFNWLAARRIVSKQDKPYLCFDSHVFAARGSAVLGGRFKIMHYWNVQQLNDRGEFSNKAIECIEERLHNLEKYSLADDEENRFLNSIKERGDDFEPILSDLDYVNPAERLVPPKQKLLTDIYLPKRDRAFADPFAHKSLLFKNNLACIYGKWVFMADQEIIEVHDLNCLFLEKFHWKETSFSIHMENCKNCAKFAADKKLDDESIDFLFLEDNFLINYLKISKFFGDDVLCVCLDGGIVLLYEMAAIFTAIGECVRRKELQRRQRVNVIPFLILRVPESCWSIDILDEGPVTYLAAGHNGPGITLLAFDRHCAATSLQPIDSCEISSLHNVPNLNFIPRSRDKEGFSMLAFCSIYGNVTTLKLKLDYKGDKKIHVRLMDSQFFSEFCWNVLPLKKENFLKVSHFEFLNLNYQAYFKKSILYSVIQDSLILGHRPPSVYSSSEFGIGVLTTQIPVPVVPLEWGCQNGFRNSGIQLRFTAFDKIGFTINAYLKPGYTENTVPGSESFSGMRKNSAPNLRERVTKNLLQENLKHFYMFGDHGTLQNEHVNGDTFKRYESLMFENVNSHEENNFSNGASFHIWKDSDEESELEPFDFHFLREMEGASPHLGKKATICSTVPLTVHNPRTFPDICGFTLTRASVESTDRLEEESHSPSEEMSSLDSHHRFLPVDGLLAAGHLEVQSKWALHNHSKKVRYLLNMVEKESTGSPCGYRLSELDDDFLFVTSAHHVYLVKTHPLIVTSFTKERIFPIDKITVCSRHEFLLALDRINFACHIRELNCIVVASQVGLLSLLRLTEYNGIYSFRQEYIFGWNSQTPGDPNCQCILSYTSLDPSGYSCRYCGIDDVTLPFYYIIGLDYSYIPEDKLNCVSAYAILYVFSGNSVCRIKIYPSSSTR